MLLGYKIFKSNLESIDFSKNKIINTINPHSYCVAKQDLEFKQALIDFRYITSRRYRNCLG